MLKSIIATSVLALTMAIPGTASASASADERSPWLAPTGSNKWNCKPTAKHPNPVVLVHGTAVPGVLNWATVSPQLVWDGYCVFSLDYGHNKGIPGLDLLPAFAPMKDSAKELATFVDHVLAATGARKVDIVGHSQGSLMPNYYVKVLGGASKVGKYVAVTPFWKGLSIFGLDALNQVGKAFVIPDAILKATLDKACGMCRDWLTDSDFMKEMRKDGSVTAPGVSYTNVMTKYDELAVPYTIGYLPEAPNVKNLVIQEQCPANLTEHFLMAVDSVVMRDIRNALDPANAKPVTC